MMKIVIEILQIWIIEGLDVLFDSFSQQLLSSFTYSQKIYHQNSLEIIKETLKVLFKRFMSEFKATINFGFCVKAYLLEKYRQAASNLDIAEAKLIDLDNLLCLTVVGNISFIIDSSVEKSSASFERRTTGNQAVFDFGSLVKNFKTADKTLNDWSLPIFGCPLVV